MNTVIKVENLSKKYLIAHQQKDSYRTLRDTMSGAFKNWGRRLTQPIRSSHVLPEDDFPTTEEFWAIKDVTFNIRQGERVGIIGRNGAGKSTLLKLLSRITEPTSGCIRTDGRVASLLEVGTGFHPELTGRENIFLNGAVLGMTRAEIRRKFDEIVAFSDVEKFLDTPVKRYSSGMYVRLAFSVAAHLEPEILIVDEVLAVGDAQFQKKCLGKMKEVDQEGRTVLFVSHNMGAIRNLCTRALLLEHGSLVADDEVGPVVDKYLSSNQDMRNSGEVKWEEHDSPSCDEISLRSIRVLGSGENVYSIYNATKPIDVEVQFLVKKPVRGMRVILTLLTADGVVAFASTNHTIVGGQDLTPGLHKTTCRIPANLLNNAGYVVNVHFGIPGTKVLIQGKEYLSFQVEGSGGHGSIYSENWPGVIAPKLDWELVEIDAD